MKLFGFKGIADSKQRTLGFVSRVFGIDISILMMGYINDWRLIELRIPANKGLFVQLLFIALFIGRLEDDQVSEVDS